MADVGEGITKLEDLENGEVDLGKTSFIMVEVGLTETEKPITIVLE